MNYKKIVIDNEKIQKLKRKIVLAETQNIYTKNKSDSQLIKDIKKWIEEDAKCCLNR